MTDATRTLVVERHQPLQPRCPVAVLQGGVLLVHVGRDVGGQELRLQLHQRDVHQGVFGARAGRKAAGAIAMIVRLPVQTLTSRQTDRQSVRRGKKQTDGHQRQKQTDRRTCS